MNACEADLAAFLSRVRVSSDGLCWLSGTGLAAVPAAPMAWPGVTGTAEASLASLLYWRFYCGLAAHAAAAAAATLDYTPVCPASYPADAGWTIATADATSLTVEKDERIRRVPPQEVVGNGRTKGEIVSLRRETWSDTRQPGFFHLFGRMLAGDFDRRFVVRFYLDMAPEDAVLNCGAIVTRMNRFQVPFLLKALTRPASFDRSDSAVLYVPRRRFAIVRSVLGALDLRLRGSRPRFTWPLLDGIGCAEDPQGGMSFGQHRCTLIARGFLWRREDPMAAIRDAFAAAGLDWARPWLNPGSADFATD